MTMDSCLCVSFDHLLFMVSMLDIKNCIPHLFTTVISTASLPHLYTGKSIPDSGYLDLDQLFSK